MEFLLTIILIFLVGGFILSRLSPWILRWWLKRLQKRYGAAGFGQQQQEPEGSIHMNVPRQQKKRLDSSTGEYVDFEEIDS